MVSYTSLMTPESINEIKRILASKEFYIAPDGELAYSASNDTLDLVLAHMTDNKPLTAV